MTTTTRSTRSVAKLTGSQRRTISAGSEPMSKGGNARLTSARVRQRRSASWRCRRNQHRGCPVDVGQQALQILDLRQIVDDDVGGSGVTRQKILMIALGRIERRPGSIFVTTGASNTCACNRLRG